MLEAYFTSILIFVIINLCVVTFFRNMYIKNGWVVEPRKPWYKRLYNTFLISAIPVFRVFITVFLMCMAFISRENLEKFVEEKQNED